MFKIFQQGSKDKKKKELAKKEAVVAGSTSAANLSAISDVQIASNRSSTKQAKIESVLKATSTLVEGIEPQQCLEDTLKMRQENLNCFSRDLGPPDMCYLIIESNK